MSEQKQAILRVRIDTSQKDALAKLCEARNTTISEEVRRLLRLELEHEQARDPIAEFDQIMSASEQTLAAYGAPEPSIEDIVAFCNDVKSERAKSALELAL